MSEKKGALSITELEKFLTTSVLGNSVALFHSIGSTNAYIKEISAFFPTGFTAFAREQTNGRGRRGKQFFSPMDKGLYMSVLIKQRSLASDALITVKACLSVCRAVEKETDVRDIGIKWVNDLYYDGKKFCGILAESCFCGEQKSVVLGIGVNLSIGRHEYGGEYARSACSLSDFAKKEGNPSRLAAGILNALEEDFLSSDSESDKALLDRYRERSILTGREVELIKDGEEITATVTGIADDASLVVRYPGGETGHLRCGEVSVRQA